LALQGAKAAANLQGATAFQPSSVDGRLPKPPFLGV